MAQKTKLVNYCILMTGYDVAIPIHRMMAIKKTNKRVFFGRQQPQRTLQKLIFFPKLDVDPASKVAQSCF